MHLQGKMGKERAHKIVERGRPTKKGNQDKVIALFQRTIEESRDQSSINYLKGLVHKEKDEFEIAEVFRKKRL